MKPWAILSSAFPIFQVKPWNFPLIFTKVWRQSAMKMNSEVFPPLQKIETRQAHQFKHILIMLITKQIWHFPKAKKYQNMIKFIFQDTEKLQKLINPKYRLFHCLHTLRWLKGHSLKFTDCETILVAFFVIPGAISVHLHTFLFPFAIRLMLVPVAIIQRCAIYIIKLTWTLPLSNAQVSILVILFHNVHNSFILLLILGGCKSSSNLFTGLECRCKVNFLPIAGEYFVSYFSYFLIQSKHWNVKS